MIFNEKTKCLVIYYTFSIKQCYDVRRISYFCGQKQALIMILKYDVIVIGGGHAGCEAACASANMGAKTCLVTMDMNKIAQMSCNPAIGGIAKGQIVREIDALGGQMGLVTDATSIQFRMLNVGKGPAVWSPRAQCDRGKFIWEWRKHLDETENLDIWQDQADELLVESKTHVRAIGVRTIWGAEIYANCAHRAKNGSWWTYRRTCCTPFHRKYHSSRDCFSSHEDRYTSAYR